MSTDTTDCPYTVGDVARLEIHGIGGRTIGIAEETVTAIHPAPWPCRYSLTITRDSPLWRHCVTYSLITPDSERTRT